MWTLKFPDGPGSGFIHKIGQLKDWKIRSGWGEDTLITGGVGLQIKEKPPSNSHFQMQPLCYDSRNLCSMYDFIQKGRMYNMWIVYVL